MKTITRRTFHRATGSVQPRPESSEPMIMSPPIQRAPTIISAPMELAGNWGRIVSRSAEMVVERMRHACLDGVRLVSDRQPTKIRVDRHTSGRWPAVWLHPDGSSMAWIIVHTGERAWMQLAISSAMSWATSRPTAGSRTPNRYRQASGSRRPWWKRSR